MLRGGRDWKVIVATWRERTWGGGRVCKPFYVKSWDRLWEEGVVGDPKVRVLDL